MEPSTSFERTRNIFPGFNLVDRGAQSKGRDMEPTSRILDHFDHKTARSICDEVGDRLQQDLSLEASPLPPYLERLLDELRKRERHQIAGVCAPADRFLHGTRR
jgi:hypothetical protein